MTCLAADHLQTRLSVVNGLAEEAMCLPFLIEQANESATNSMCRGETCAKSTDSWCAPKNLRRSANSLPG